MSNVADAVFAHGSAHPTRVAVRAGDLEVTFGELRDHVASYAGRVRDAGIAPGDRVVLIAPTGAEFVAAYYGLHAAGAVLITMNVMATAAEVDYVLEDSGASLVVAWHEAATAAGRAAEGRGLPLWALPPLPARPTDDAAPVSAPVDRADDDTAIIIYTSGTTGRPKGAELGVGGIGALVEAARHQLQFDPTTDRNGTALPLFHVYGQLMVMHIAISLGTPVSLLHPFDPAAMIAMIREHGLTFVAGVPAMWIAMLHVAGDAGRDDLASVRVASSGGASLPAEVIDAFERRFGVRLREGYGLSETSGWATSSPPGAEPKPGTVGRAVHGMRLEVRDAAGRPVPTGEVGEVWVSGPIVMKGYWNRPEATAETIRDGWLRTGDLGTLDSDGDLRIVDRLKDMIIRGGYNVYPREVEEVLHTHPDVVEAAVVGVPDPRYGEEVAAAVVLRPGATLDAEELRRWAKERLSAYKVPHLVQVLPALPKGPSGKILKRALDRDALRAAPPS
ncbi:long-chain fatty acid--CoA ligase [Nocardioides lentus]|uniref:Long-chain fatty acid--CoA ligase n=1 Tax=Nocardioides lentus TaxID=338077 RepID=A0ABP5B2Y3_9ACTN